MSEYRAGAVIPDQTAADQEVRPDFHNTSAMAVTHEPFTGLAALVDTLENEIEEVSSEAEVGLLKTFVTDYNDKMVEDFAGKFTQLKPKLEGYDAMMERNEQWKNDCGEEIRKHMEGQRDLIIGLQGQQVETGRQAQNLRTLYDEAKAHITAINKKLQDGGEAWGGWNDGKWKKK